MDICISMDTYSYLEHTHDLPRLSLWGPYARDLYCLSHIADKSRGLRMDFAMIPGVFMRRSYLPETLREADCTPMESAADLSYFSFRQQLEGQDVFYSDVSYSRLKEDLWLGRAEFVNHTDEHRAGSIFVMERMAPENEVWPCLPKNARWIDGLDYRKMEFSYARFDHNLVYGGGRRGEEQNFPGTVGGHCLGQPKTEHILPCFGACGGDRVLYEFSSPAAYGVVYLRYRVEKGRTAAFRCRVNSDNRLFVLAGSGKFALKEMFRGFLGEKTELEIIANDGSDGIRIDGLVVGPVEMTPRNIRFIPIGRSVNPSFQACNLDNAGIISGKGLGTSYGFWHSAAASACHEAWISDTEKLVNYSYILRRSTTKSLWEYPGDHYFHDSYILPVQVPPKSHAIIHALFSSGKTTDTAFGLIDKIGRSEEALEKYYREARERRIQFHPAEGGKKYLFTQNITAATCMTNINFPVVTQGEHIRHHVPDKYFNSLYQWDSGFIGLGLLELDKTRAVENLNVYLTNPKYDENAFVLYGTPMPTQAYLYAEIWNRFQDEDVLRHFYPGLMHFYSFIAGHVQTSLYKTAQSGLLRSWDYFYNSGGWDDYPPQLYMAQHQMRNIAPAVTTAHAIRFAKILGHAAHLLKKNDDLALLARDIRDFTYALQKYSWSEKDGIFSYVNHDEKGKPLGFWMAPASGVNFNFGMDGASPLVSGICTKKQRDLLFHRLADPKGMWTKAGISTVDKRAPYFRTDGYWNGCVWMPHQWFFWKSALDDNRAKFAQKIASTALNMWHREVQKSRYTFEFFSILNQRGAGCCHFGGLSSPVLNWYAAYYETKRLTGGFDTWFEHIEYRNNSICAKLQIEGEPGEFCTVIFVSGGGEWTACYNHRKVPVTRGIDTSLEITLPKHSSGCLIIRRLYAS